MDAGFGLNRQAGRGATDCCDAASFDAPLGCPVESQSFDEHGPVPQADGRIKMARIVFFQFLTTLVVAIAAWLISGVPAAISALLGGAACLLPNGLFALRLALASRQLGGTNPMTFLVGEFVKLVVTVLLMALIATTYKDLNWLAMLVSIIAVLNSYVLALIVKD
ncbi:MAG: ATP synthase subunit I [Burkholderiaceae bacterium]